MRVGAQPIEHLEVGASMLYGVEGTVRAGADPGSAKDLRYGGWIRFSNDRIDARAEAIFQTFTIEGDSAAGISDVDVPAGGAYVLGEYRVVQNLGIGARLDWFDSNSQTEGDRSVNTNITGGVNWYLDDYHAKLQVAYTASIEGDLSNDERIEASGQEADDQVTLVAQVAF